MVQKSTDYWFVKPLLTEFIYEILYCMSYIAQMPHQGPTFNLYLQLFTGLLLLSVFVVNENLTPL